MITLTFSFPSIEALAAFITKNNAPLVAVAAAPERAGAPDPQPSTPAATPPAPSAENPPQPKKPGRPKKEATTTTPPGTPASTTVAKVDPATPRTHTADDVRAALMKVNDKFGAEGLAKVADVIKPFGAAYIKDIKPEDFAKVIAAAEKAAA